MKQFVRNKADLLATLESEICLNTNKPKHINKPFFKAFSSLIEHQTFCK